jgi:hypothetical protein
MRLWNLSEFSALETPVIESYSPAMAHSKRRAPRRGASRFKIAVSVAALTATFSIGVVNANAFNVSLPLSAVGVAQSVAEPRPPLAGFFEGRFASEWTEQLENELLTRVETNRLQGSSAPLIEQTIDVVFSNQHEDLSDTTADRLTRDQIAALVKTHKPRR